MDLYEGPIPHVDEQIFNEVVRKDLKGERFLTEVRSLSIEWGWKVSLISSHTFAHHLKLSPRTHAHTYTQIQPTGNKLQLAQAFERAQEVEPPSNVNDRLLSSSNENSSWREYRDAAARHVRKPEGPRDLLLKPLTSSQEVGWACTGSDAFPTKVYAKKSCEETKYASHLVKSGVV